MDVNIFWEIIGEYNNKTIIVQIILFVLGIFARFKNLKLGVMGAVS